MPTEHDASGYSYSNDATSHAHAYLLPVVIATLRAFYSRRRSNPCRVFDLGCGNGSVAASLTAEGYQVVGVDPSSEGIAQANKAWPGLSLHCGSGYDDLKSQFGTFPAVVSLEVVEHVYAPREFAATLFSLVEHGGIAIVSTPYHSYVKNLALSICGKMDAHFTALWDHGHIKFWSAKTLGTLLGEAGFQTVSFRRAGRVPILAKSMIAIAQKSKD